MGIKAAIFGAVGMVIFLMGFSLYLTGKAYLAERDKVTVLAHAAEITELTTAAKEEKEDALRLQKEGYDKLLEDQKDLHNEKTADFNKRLVSARNDALQKPIQFGDDLFRDLIYADCVRGLPADSDRVEGRDACLRSSRIADPSSSGLSYSVLTPTFLTGWAKACEEWTTVSDVVRPGEDDLAYTREDWDNDFGNMDPKLCQETLVALTPEASLFLQNFVNNGTAYIENLLSYIIEQRDAIEILTRPKPGQPEAE